MATRLKRYLPGTLAFALAGCGGGDADMAATGNSSDCGPSGEYAFVCGVPNAEDLVVVPGTPWVFSSAMIAGEPIYLVDSRTRTAVPAWPTADSSSDYAADTYLNCPGEPETAGLYTHGLSLRRFSDGATKLYAVSHGSREAIEVFDVDTSAQTPTLTWEGCVLMPEGLEANSVTSLDDGSLLATVLIYPDRTFEDAMAGRPTGGVYQWTPGGDDFVLIDGTSLAGNNGIEVSADGSEIFVAASGSQVIVAFDRSNPARQLRTTTRLPIIPDNVHRREDGSMLTAGTIVDTPACGGLPDPAEFDIEAYAACPRGFMALSVDPRTMQYEVLAQGGAIEEFSNATMAVEVGDEVWVGTFAGDRIAIVNR